MARFSLKNIFRKNSIHMIIAVSILILFASCIVLFLHLSGSKSDDKAVEQPVALTNFTIADSKITLRDQTSATLKLVLTKGNNDTNEPNGSGDGIDDVNYKGNYELQLTNSVGDMLSSLDLNKDWNCSTINFADKFEILCTDYNNDSCPDFTIGTSVSAGVMQYYLYSISEDYQICRICQTPIVEMSLEPSIVFETDQNGSGQFLNYYYDSASGNCSHRFYRWDEESGSYRIDKEIKFNENGEPIVTEAASTNNTDDEVTPAPDDMAIKDVADERIQEYLNSEEGKLLKQSADSFVKAYFSGDKDSAYAYLAENSEYDNYVYNDYEGNVINVYDKLTHILAKWYTASDQDANVQYEYEVEGEDSYTYLDLDLENIDNNWVITGIYLEK